MLLRVGDYDALLVLMMLPRMTFKAELVIDQLKQQHTFDDALGSLSTVTPAKADQLTFVSLLVYKLTSLNMLVKKANRSVSVRFRTPHMTNVRTSPLVWLIGLSFLSGYHSNNKCNQDIFVVRTLL